MNTKDVDSMSVPIKWRLGADGYRVFVPGFYERGRAQRVLTLRNHGTARDSTQIVYEDS